VQICPEAHFPLFYILPIFPMGETVRT
jgi:hypothetical protein